MMAGLFSDPKHAERAYRSLFARGYRADEVIVVIPEATWRSLFAPSADAAADAQPVASSTNDENALPVPVPIAVSTSAPSKRVMAAGRIATLLDPASRRSVGSDRLTSALAACGIPHRLTHDCAAGIEAGQILLGVIPRNAADSAALGDEWERRSGKVLER